MTGDNATRSPQWIKPEDYEVFGMVNLCGIRLIDTPVIFQLPNMVQPLLIGKGKVPRVWISAPLDQSRLQWGFVVNDSVALHPAFKIKKSGRNLTIHAGKTLIIAARAHGEDEVIVSELDLRPVGLDIRGDSRALKIGSNEMSAFTLSSSPAAFGIR